MSSISPPLCARRGCRRAAVRFAGIFWPGPLTLVAHAAPERSVCELARAGLETVALRVPAHPVALALLRAFGGPIAAPSANVSGHVSPVTAQHVADDLSEKVDMILDGGRTPAGLESTIVSFVDDVPRLLRPGAIARSDIKAVLGRELASLSRGDEDILAPGMTASHYAPNARLRLNARDLEEGEAGLDFGGVLTKAAGSNLVLDLSAQGDLVEAAANLFAHLRALDARGVSRVAVAPVPLSGLGEAINDRLQRAASPR